MAFSRTESKEKVPKCRPSVHGRAVVGAIKKWRSNRVRFETCWYDEATPAKIRAVFGHCSRLFVNPEFFRNMIEIPYGWTNAIHHSMSQQYLDKVLLGSLIAGRTGRKEGGQACYFSAAHPPKNKAVLPSEKVETTAPTMHTDTGYEVDSVKAQQIGSKFRSNIQSCCCSLRRRSSRMYCKSRWPRSEELV